MIDAFRVGKNQHTHTKHAEVRQWRNQKNDNPHKWESQSDKEATYALPSFRAIIPWKTIQYLISEKQRAKWFQ